VRARRPDLSSSIVRNAVTVAYDVYNTDGSPTVLLLPTWQVANAEHWKAQIPVLARRHRVVTIDGRGTGRSDRPTDPVSYADEEVVADAIAVLDAIGAPHAVLAGVSCGGALAAQLACAHPGRVLGAVMIAPSMDLTPPLPHRMEHDFDTVYEEPTGWALYSEDAWRHHYERFIEFFWGQICTEPHSTKQIEDGIGWARDTGNEVLLATARRHSICDTRSKVEAMLSAIRCPTLLIHGRDDAVVPWQRSQSTADITGGDLLFIEGGGHVPQARDPIRVNQALLDFIDRVTPPADRRPRRTSWTRALDRPEKLLYLSSPIGLGHARRDLAIARELRRARPDLQVEWLSQHPVTALLEHAGETVHPGSRELVSESTHFEGETHEHSLHAFQAVRRMDEILVANFSILQELVDSGDYDLVVGDEAWDVDHFWHENPELKKTAYVWMTDFVGWLPMPEGGAREAELTTDYNAEMLEHVGRFGRVRDRSIFVGDPEDVVAESFGPGLPDIRAWTEGHYAFSGYITGFEVPDESHRQELRSSLGCANGERLVIVTAGGTRAGESLLRKVAASYTFARKAIDGLRMLIVCGPRIDPAAIRAGEGIEVRGYVPDLYLHLAACDAAIVQGGLTTTMELVAAQRPFLYFPLANHFEQQGHVRHRLRRYGAGRCLNYSEIDAEGIAEALVEEIARPVRYLPVTNDGAQRAAGLINEVLA
jgi:pimeloyl-ACP methyl ester carboxylesterase/predicted glycosyltransferase